MNSKLKLSLIAVIGVALIVLVLTLVQRPDQNVPAKNTPTQPGISDGTSVIPSVATPTTPAVVAGATDQPTSGATAPTPAPEPTMTAEEQRVVGDVLKSSPQFTASSGDCDKILQSEPWCSLVKDARQITRPEWEGLFPQTKFFLVKRNVAGQGAGFQQNLLVIEQAGQQYSADTFDRLLSTNDIVVTDTKRELIARAFALMTIPDYLEGEISFIEWKEGNWPTSYNYDHVLKAWTKIQGLEIWWWFDFEDGRLRAVTRSDPNLHVGNYLVVPFEVLPFPRAKDYEFFGGTK